MKPLYIPSPRQLVKQFLETDFYEDPDMIPNIELFPEACPISDSIADLEKWVNQQAITRTITTIWIHCTGTPVNTSVESIRRYWSNNLGWKNPGYHIVFSQEGYTVLQDLQYPTNGVRGHNAKGIHLSYVGGLQNGKAIDTRNLNQAQMLHATVQMLLLRWPHLDVRGHNEVSAKACPCFNVMQEFSYARK